MSALLMLVGLALAQDCTSAETCLAQGLEASLVEGDASAAEAALKTACEQGEATACFHRALSELARGEQSEVPLSEPGQAELKRRCEAEQPLACLQLGVLHDRGPMAWRDTSQASMYFRQACAAGHAEGCKAACELGHSPSCAPEKAAPEPAQE